MYLWGWLDHIHTCSREVLTDIKGNPVMSYVCVGRSVKGHQGNPEMSYVWDWLDLAHMHSKEVLKDIKGNPTMSYVL